ncbi:hypothetical protein GCM10027595_10570 [Corynebacterium nasicanis]
MYRKSIERIHLMDFSSFAINWVTSPFEFLFEWVQAPFAFLSSKF